MLPTVQMLTAVVHNGRKRELLDFQARLLSHDMEYHMHNTRLDFTKCQQACIHTPLLLLINLQKLLFLSYNLHHGQPIVFPQVLKLLPQVQGHYGGCHEGSSSAFILHRYKQKQE